MPGFKDILKKAAEAAQKGLAKIQEAAEFERLMSDFDEVVASVATDILTEKGIQADWAEGGREEVPCRASYRERRLGEARHR